MTQGFPFSADVPWIGGGEDRPWRSSLDSITKLGACYEK
jgi:hypothetical protein